MRMSKVALIAVLLAVLALPAAAVAQDDQVGQQGDVWNLGELAPGTYPSTVTAVNQSCPGAHDFHVSLIGEAAEFLVMVGPSVLRGIPPGERKTSDVIFDLRSMAPGPHNEGQIAVKCVSCPFSCSQDYDLLSVQLTVTGDANAAPPSNAAGSDPFWGGIDLMTLDPSTALPPNGVNAPPSLRWVQQSALERMTTVQDALDEGMATLQFTGTGHAGGTIFIVEITRTTATPFEMGFPLGTLIVPDDPSYSPMMVGDDGAVALLEEVTQVTMSGYLLDPRLQQPPTAAQIDSSGGPGWGVAAPPQSGSFADAVSFINTAYAIAGELSTEVPMDGYLQVVVQRTIWAEADSEEFGKERLQMDIIAQAIALGKPADPEQVESAVDEIWNDLSQLANLGKVR